MLRVARARVKPPSFRLPSAGARDNARPVTRAASLSTAALALLACVAPLLCVPGQYEAANLPQSAWIDVGAWLLLAACLARRLRVAAIPLALLAFLSWALVALSTAEQRGPGFALFVHWASCAALFMAARATFAATGEPRAVLAALSGSASLVATIGLAQHLEYAAL